MVDEKHGEEAKEVTAVVEWREEAEKEVVIVDPEMVARRQFADDLADLRFSSMFSWILHLEKNTGILHEKYRYNK